MDFCKIVEIPSRLKLRRIRQSIFFELCQEVVLRSLLLQSVGFFFENIYLFIDWQFRQDKYSPISLTGAIFNV